MGKLLRNSCLRRGFANLRAVSKSPQIGALVHGCSEPSILERVVAGLSSAGVTQVVVVVDDAPGEDLLGAVAGVSVVRNHGTLACGARQKAGYRAALDLGWTRIVTLRGDGSHEGADAAALLRALEGGAEVAIGSRLAAGGGGLPAPRWVALASLSLVERTLHGANLRDPHSGLRALDARVLDQVDFESLSPGRPFDLELLLACAERNLRIEEVGVRGTSGLDLTASLPYALKCLGKSAETFLARARGRLAFPGIPRSASVPSVGSVSLPAQSSEPPPAQDDSRPKGPRRLPTV